MCNAFMYKALNDWIIELMYFIIHELHGISKIHYQVLLRMHT